MEQTTQTPDSELIVAQNEFLDEQQSISMVRTPEQLKQERHDFVNEMVSYYGADPNGRRSIDGRNCKYRGPQKRQCAIGRYIPDDKYSRLFEGYSIATSFGQRNIFAALPPTIQELGLVFLGHVQALHDSQGHWKSTGGLTETGEQFVTDLRRLIDFADFTTNSYQLLKA